MKMGAAALPNLKTKDKYSTLGKEALKAAWETLRETVQTNHENLA